MKTEKLEHTIFASRRHQNCPLSDGVDIVSPSTDQTWAHRTMFFRDPDGNLLEIYANIKARQPSAKS